MKFLPLLLVVPLFLLGACVGDRDSDDSQVIGTQKVIRAMPSPGRIEDAKRGRELWFSYGAVSGVEGTPANGVVKAHMFEDRTYLSTIELNIEIPKRGMFYEMWLWDEGANEMVSAGHLVNRFGDTRHSLTYEIQRDLTDHRSVLVTLEYDDGDPAPGERVAEGTLKVVER